MSEDLCSFNGCSFGRASAQKFPVPELGVFAACFVSLDMTTPCLPSASRRFASLVVALCCLAPAVFAAAAVAAETVTKSFDIPANSADKTLRLFSVQSGVEVVFGTATAAQVRTNAVKGDYAPREALDRLIDGTGLIVVANEKTGALTVSRGPKGQRVAPTSNHPND